MTVSASGPRRLMLVAALGPVAVAAAACSGPASSSPPPAPRTTYAAPARMAKCATSALRIKIGASTAATGIAYRNIDFTNVGSAKCFLQGYPAVAMVSAGSDSGNLVGAYARPYTATPAKPIVLASGQTAHAIVGVYKLGSHLATNCDPATPHWLKVFPPGQTMPAYVPFIARICAAGAARTLQITPIVAGT
jgi:Protein of unknown function (DUF4232)